MGIVHRLKSSPAYVTCPCRGHQALPGVPWLLLAVWGGGGLLSLLCWLWLVRALVAWLGG